MSARKTVTTARGTHTQREKNNKNKNKITETPPLLTSSISAVEGERERERMNSFLGRLRVMSRARISFHLVWAPNKFLTAQMAGGDIIRNYIVCYSSTSATHSSEMFTYIAENKQISRLAVEIQSQQ